jgi:hypothetical protein
MASGLRPVFGRWSRAMVKPRRVWPLSVGLVLFPLYVYFVWRSRNWNDWGWWDTIGYFLTFVPSKISEAAGGSDLIFWTVSIVAVPALAAMMAYGPPVLVAVGVVIAAPMAGPLMLMTLVMAIVLVASIFEFPLTIIPIAVFTAYVFAVRYGIRRWVT